jgi:hypothetical protein
MHSQRGLTKVVLFIFCSTIIAYGLFPTDQLSDSSSWIVIVLQAVTTVYLSISYRQKLQTWRAWIMVVGILAVALIWLRTYGTSSSALIQHLNVSLAVLAWSGFIALFSASALLLRRSEGSVIFLAVSFSLIPIVLIAISIIYGTQAQLSNAPLGDQVLWSVPLIWSMCIGSISLPVFLLHLLNLLLKEIRAR